MALTMYRTEPHCTECIGKADSQMLTVKAAAAAWGGDIQLVYRLIRNNRIPWIKVGKVGIRIPRVAFEQWIAAHPIQPFVRGPRGSYIRNSKHLPHVEGDTLLRLSR
jgi:excisionase family DNA binding protein